MRRGKLLILILEVIALSLFIIGYAIAEVAVDLEYAKDLHRHNLTDKAKEAFITIFHDGVFCINPRKGAFRFYAAVMNMRSTL